MYVRQISRVNKDGTRIRYLQLAHKVRDPETGMPRDKVLHHFGRADQIDPEQLKRLIKSISRFLDPAEQVQIEAGLDSAVTSSSSAASPSAAATSWTSSGSAWSSTRPWPGS